MWKPDRTSGQPIYRQITDMLERSISYGELPPGSLLPSERKLAEQLGVNRSTIVQAYEELRASGLITSSIGSGTRVSRTKWGITPTHTPNWRQYTEGGTFLPNLPLMRRIREALRIHPATIDLASGELSADLFPNERVQTLLQEQPFQEHLGYDHPQGYYPLRTAIASYLGHYHGIDTTEASILVTSGSQQSLYLITQCLLSPGDAVAIEEPSYCYSLPMFQSAGLRLFGLPVHEDGIDPEEVIKLYRQHRIRMIFVNPNYQNPTGTTMSESKRARLLAIASELRIPIVEDDPFSMTSMSGLPPAPLKSIDKEGTVLYIGSLSKIASSGLRIGWMIAPQAVVNRLADARQQMDFGLSIVSEWIAERIISSDYFDLDMPKLRFALERKQQTMIDALRQHLPGCLSFHEPRGGLNLWCKLHQKIDESRFLEEGIKRGIVFVPGSVYGSDEGFIRLSYAKPRLMDIEPAIAALAEALRAAAER